ncbi:unnamed protein product [Discula destructiva]
MLQGTLCGTALPTQTAHQLQQAGTVKPSSAHTTLRDVHTATNVLLALLRTPVRDLPTVLEAPTSIRTTRLVELNVRILETDSATTRLSVQPKISTPRSVARGAALSSQALVRPAPNHTLSLDNREAENTTFLRLRPDPSGLG